MDRATLGDLRMVSIADVRAAAERLRGVINQTPMQPSRTFGEIAGYPVWLKPESLQKTGSFKIRGAYNTISLLGDQERARGVITYSSGNHAQGVAYAAQQLGVKAVIVMPENAIPAKVAATRGYGAQVEFAGLDSLQRQKRAEELVAEHGYQMIPPFDHPDLVAGQGTVSLEILTENPEIATIVVPIGGGGLSSGVALAAKQLAGRVRVVGVEPERAADAKASLEQGRIVEAERIDTVADGLRVKRIGSLNFEILRKYLDEVVTVTEEEILAAVGSLAERAKLVVEPSGAVTLAAVVNGKVRSTGPTAVILSGGNVDKQLLAQVLTS